MRIELKLTALLFSIETILADYCSTIHEEFGRRQLLEHNTNTPFTQDDGNKHTPFITTENGVATVTVGDGNPYHPMTASENPDSVHFITDIYVMDQDDNFIYSESLDPSKGTPAMISFTVPAGTTKLTAYEWCNKHGLWVGPTVEVESPTGPQLTCNVDMIDSTARPSIRAELFRLQSLPPFSETDSYTEDDGAKHTPYITVSDDGHSGSVVVGTEVVYHPMDASRPHWITTIYITDESDEIIAMKALDPNGVSKAEMTFDIPDGTKSVTPWEFCNMHGLWVGPTVMIDSHEHDKDDSHVGDVDEDEHHDELELNGLDEEESGGTTSGIASSIAAAVFASALTSFFS